jgi:hypothetical protein
MSIWNFNLNSSRPRLFVTKQPSAARVRFTECFNPNAALMRAEALSRKEGL